MTDELDQFGAEEDDAMLAERAADIAHVTRHKIHAASEYATLFYAGSERLKDVEQVEDYRKNIKQFLEQKEEGQKHRMMRHIEGQKINKWIACEEKSIYEKICGRCVDYKWMQNGEAKKHSNDVTSFLMDMICWEEWIETEDMLFGVEHVLGIHSKLRSRFLNMCPQRDTETNLSTEGKCRRADFLKKKKIIHLEKTVKVTTE